MSNHDKHAIWSTMQAKPGREGDVRDFLTEAARRLNDEPGTTEFYAMELGEGQFAIINIILDNAAFDAHVSGPVADWVRSQAADLLTDGFSITKGEIFATKSSVAGESA